MATKRATAKSTRKKKSASASSSSKRKSVPKEGKNPKGGLTAEGRKFFNRTQGSHLKAGVTGAADTPEKMKRKGSFLRRHFANPRGPMQDEQGRPTRLALSAHAWGEPVPKDMAAAKKLAAKGHALLEKYQQLQGKATGKETPAKRVARVAKKGSAAARTPKPVASKSSSVKKRSRLKKTTAKGTAK